MSKLEDDLKFGSRAETEFIIELRKRGWRVEMGEDKSIIDFRIYDDKGAEVYIELKSRRCSVNDYEDTMIGVNKISSAYERYYSTGQYTLFCFQFTDGLYVVSPFVTMPRFEYKLGRWDRGNIDKPKGRAYYNTKDLQQL